jgi:hypothetical protein
MQRYDRAIYTILLLALLADIARAAAPVTGLPADGFMLVAAAQLPAEASSAVLHRARPPASQSRPVSRLSVLSRWPRLFHASESSYPVALTADLPPAESGSASYLISNLQSRNTSSPVFEHTASPAP